VTSSTGSSLGLYQLAGRKLLQDFEEGRASYLEDIYDKTREPTKYAELIAREGTRVGVEFGLASKWTSFVAVAEDRSTGERQAGERVGESAVVFTEGETQTADSVPIRPSSSVAGSRPVVYHPGCGADFGFGGLHDPNLLQQYTLQMQQAQVKAPQQLSFGRGGVGFGASPGVPWGQRRIATAGGRKHLWATIAQDDEALNLVARAQLLLCYRRTPKTPHLQPLTYYHLIPLRVALCPHRVALGPLCIALHRQGTAPPPRRGVVQHENPSITITELHIFCDLPII